MSGPVKCDSGLLCLMPAPDFCRGQVCERIRKAAARRATPSVGRSATVSQAPPTDDALAQIRYVLENVCEACVNSGNVVFSAQEALGRIEQQLKDAEICECGHPRFLHDEVFCLRLECRCTEFKRWAAIYDNEV